MAASSFPVLSRILSANAQWARDVSQVEPGFFEKSAQGQAPKVLWIGCADSRVPESVVAAAKPGEIFVHRNIANQVHLNDDSVLSVLTYAIMHLGVEHVVVAGHTNCGGAAAALSESTKAPSEATSPLARFLAPIVDVARKLNFGSPPPPDALDAVIAENVRQQVCNICDILKQAWSEGKNVHVHGWVYELEHGTLKDLDISVGPRH
ncbi:carbonic anhydrase [Exidia glandulosa HHB12029]|uniref:Carbonic anhydrase n=1 Tax=Exidia glandulosa HHB12029 TaxID=1314781 RepID=A0A166AF98_EXIGL|nr:carbonic anhydrase [Exidia glandulosa HHB12029]